MKTRSVIPFVLFLVSLSGCLIEPESGGSETDAVDAVDAVDKDEPTPTGLVVDTPGATPGYVLFGPLTATTTYLVDRNGQVVHQWASDLPPGSLYLRDNGNLLRTEKEPDVPTFNGGGQSGRIREYTWDGELVWDFLLATEDQLTHHDIEPLPNGNILAIVWERKTAEESKQAGRRPGQIPEAGLWPDAVLELAPEPPNGATVVWEWHAWDHLIQNVDENADNFGDPAAHPEKIDINGDVAAAVVSDEELEQLKALGYVPEEADQEDLSSDLFHTNSVHYNAELDQILMSSPRFDEIRIIDHSTTTEEAAGSSGGRWGRGGDLLYRWGNALAYGRAENTPKQLFGQHDARWIPEGYPGAGNIMMFNNDLKDDAGNDYSAIYEIVPPVDDAGNYIVPEAGPFGPAEPVWSYVAPDQVSFHSRFISGAHRLPNGNTFICSGAQGRLFEVTPEGEIVWEYWNPFSGDADTSGRLDETPRAAFRATKILPDHPALADKDLTPLDPQPMQ